MALHVSFYVSNKNKLSILINQLLIVYCLLCCYFIYNLVLIHFFNVRKSYKRKLMCLTVVGMVILSQCQGYICYCKGHGECVVHVL